MAIITLSGQERAALRKQAQKLDPMVSIGKSGYSSAVRKAIDESLTAHELVKVKFQDCKDERKEIMQRCAVELKAVMVAVTGNTGVLFRKHDDVEDVKGGR